MYASYTTTTKQMEVVEWLRWYRYAVKEILAGEVVHGTGYFDEIERNFHAAIHAAYHGPEIEIFDLIPDRFEAEVSSVYDTPEVLHLVSGRDLFGMVRIFYNFLDLSNIRYEKLSPSGSIGLLSSTFLGNEMRQSKFAGMKFNQVKLGGQKTMKYHATDAYKNLELHLFGKLVATATRAPTDSRAGDLDGKEAHDQIHVFLSSRDESSGGGFSKTTMSDNTHLEILVGTISGLGTNPEESSCYAYDRKGSKTHVILKHRTLLLSICECRCTRARLPPSKYWLFEPRCSMHDIGGWNVETYGRDKKARTVPSARYWDGADTDPPSEKLVASLVGELL